MKKIIFSGVTLLTMALLVYLFLPVLSIHFIHIPVMVFVFALVIMGGSFLTKGKESTDGKIKLTGLQRATTGIVGVLTIALLVMFVSQFSLFNWKTKQAELKITHTEDFNRTVSYADVQNLVILDEENALRSCERLITETNPTLGSQFQIGEGTLTVVDEKPYWVFPLEYRGFFKWLSTKGEIPGFIKISATHSNDAEFVEYTYNLSPSGRFSSDLRRAIYTKYPQYGITDLSFEVDDKGEGRWVVTAYSNKNWMATPYVTGSIIVNPATGEMTFYEVGKQPSWVNRVFGMEFFKDQLKWYGKYIEGWWNPSDKGKLQDTEGVGYVFKDKEIYFYTGLTSVGKDSATTGFMIYNPRTGEGVYNKLSGSIESRAMASMEELVQNAGYIASFPYLINVNGIPTYFSTLKGNSGNIVGYAFASVENYKAVAQGKTLREAQTEYSKVLLRESIVNELAEQTDNAESISAPIYRIGLLASGDYAVQFEKDSRVFIVSSEQFPKVALSQAGDNAKVTFLETSDTDRIDALKFENFTLK